MSMIQLLFLSVSAGFLQLTDRHNSVELDGSSVENSGYIKLTGSDEKFNEHVMESQNFALTMWVQQYVVNEGDITLALFQSSGISTGSGSAGTNIPLLQKTASDLKVCIDTSVSVNSCQQQPAALAGVYNWSMVSISYWTATSVLTLCISTWRSTSSWFGNAISGNVITFDTNSVAYLGGSPYTAGLQGRIVDVRFYDTTWYDLNGLEKIALGRHCSAECIQNCYGPDIFSCQGLQFLHSYYSQTLDPSGWVNPQYITFPGTDIKFKGHALGSTEMTASAWVVGISLTSSDQQIWRFTNQSVGSFSDSEPGDRILTVFIKSNEITVRTGLQANWDFVCTVSTGGSWSNTWIHIGVSVSETSRFLRLCVTAWGESPQCQTETTSSDVIPFLTTGHLIFGDSISLVSTFKIVDFRFLPTYAATEEWFQMVVNHRHATWAPSCDGCWGPDASSCNDYIQLTDPRTAQKYDSTDSGDATTLSGSHPVMAYYEGVGSPTYTISMWVKRNGPASGIDTIFRAKHVNQDTSQPGQRVPIIQLNHSAAGSVSYEISDTGGGTNVASVSGITTTGTWLHINFGARDQPSFRHHICVATFVSPPGSMAEKWTTSDHLDADQWDPTQAIAEIIVGGDYSWGDDTFDGFIVDARYYPNTFYDTNDHIIDSFLCVNGVDTCSGPDDTSGDYVALTEAGYEYTTLTSGGEGKDHWHIAADHFMFKDISPTIDYTVSAWVMGEKKMVSDTMLLRITINGNNGGINGETNKTPAIMYQTTQIDGWVDTELQADFWAAPTHTTLGLEFKQYWQTWISVCGSNNTIETWITKDGATISCIQSGITNGTARMFDTNDSNVYLGSDLHNSKSNLRITDVRFYPNTCFTQAQINSKLDLLGCNNVAWGWNGSCYGPGRNSCVYETYLQILDEHEPFVGNGSQALAFKRGFDLEFENRYMSSGTWSISVWFYLSSYTSGTTIDLIQLTHSQSCSTADFQCESPRIYIFGSPNPQIIVVLNNQTAANSGVTPQSISIQTWYLVVLTMSQVTELMILYLSPWQGTPVQTNSFSTITAPGYFDSQGYLYYGGGTVGAAVLDGYMFDLRYWDTFALTAADVIAMVSEKTSWHKRCAVSCTGPTFYDCKACRSPYLYHEGVWLLSCPSGYLSYGTECVASFSCPAGTYTGESSCENCDPACATCTGAGTGEYCSECINPYLRQDGECVTQCGQQYYSDTVSFPEYQWYPCDVSCDKCTGAGNLLWNSCTRGYYMWPDEPWCQTTCPQDYIPNASTGRCSKCDISWVGGWNGEVGSWDWKDGYYFDEQDGSCQPCYETCYSCTSATICTYWLGDCILDDGECVPCTYFYGYGGYLPAPNVLTADNKCNPVCGDGILTLKEECEDGNIEDKDGCSSQCRVEDGYDCDGGTWVDLSAPSGILEQQGLNQNEYTILIYFDQEVVIQENLGNNISLSVNNDIQITSWEMSESTEKKYNAYKIVATIQQDVGEDSVLTVEIDTQITDLSGLELREYELFVQLDTKITIEFSQVAMDTTQAIARASVAIGGASVVLSSVLSGSSAATGGISCLILEPSTFWGFVEILQIINFMVFMSFAQPILLTEFYRILAFTQGDFIPNVFEYWVEDTGIAPAFRFSVEEQSTNFLLTGGSIVMAFVINGLMLVGFTLLSLLKPKVEFFTKSRNDLICATPIRVAVEGFLELSLAFMLQFRNFGDTNSINVLGLFLSMFTVIGYIGVVYILFVKVIFASAEVLDSEQTQNKYGALYEGYKTNHWAYRSFSGFEKIRKLLFVGMLVVLTDYPKEQVYSIIVLQFIWTITNVIVRPFASHLERFMRLTMEFSLLAAFLLIEVLTNENSDEKLKEQASWSVVGILGILVIGFASFVLLQGLIGLVVSLIDLTKKICAKFRSRKKTRIQPESSFSDDSITMEIRNLHINSRKDINDQPTKTSESKKPNLGIPAMPDRTYDYVKDYN